MKRRKFIKNLGKASASAFAMPYILPSGRLFARNNVPTSDHVVFVLFAGGVRQQEAVLQRYLDDSQGFASEGNIMYNLLNGAPPEIKIVYGTDTASGQPGGQPIPRILQNPLQSQGTLFKEVLFDGGAGHYYGLSTAISGFYGVTQGLRQRPLHPTIFEYVRRFRGEKATKAWFIGNSIANSTPLLNHSEYEGFGSRYGANFFAPNVTFGMPGENYLKGFKNYHPEEELGPARQMQAFLNNNFLLNGGEIPNLNNTAEEKQDIKDFIKDVFQKKDTNQIPFPPVSDNGDLSTIAYSCLALKWFKPTVTVINMSAVDSCHSSFTNYLKSLHRADHGVGHLWNYIQTQIPEMAGKTSLIVMPEHGRNLEPNPISDVNDWFAFDHGNEPNAQRIFSMMAGPGIDAGLVVENGIDPVADAADVSLTIAEMLGIKNDVMNTGLIAPGALSLFDRI